jgi:PleD family two-component response regulator
MLRSIVAGLSRLARVSTDLHRRAEQDMAFDLSMPILVVDDYSTMIRIIRNLLKQISFENVDDASDGSAALARM